MANLYQTTIEAVQHVPTDWERPVLAGAAVLSVAGLGVAAKYHHNHTGEKGAVDARGQSEALWESRIGTEKRTNENLFSPVRQVAAGAALVGLYFAGQPGYEASYPDAKAEAMVVADVSSSMLFTEDLGDAKVSRYDATVSGIKDAEFAGTLGFIQTAASAKIISKPTKDWRQQVASIELPQVDPNGGQLLPALEQAASLFNENPQTKKRNGTIILISDGTVSETPQALTAQAKKLKDLGVTVNVVVPGTDEGTYVLPQTTQTTKSAVKADSLGSFDKNIVKTKTVDQTIEAINEEIKSAGTRREHEDWPVPWMLGAAIGAIGVGRLVKRVVNREI